MRKKIYIVKSYGGQWEDSWETIVGIYDNETMAKIIALSEWDKQVNWKNYLPIPFEIYQNTIKNEDIEQLLEWDEDDETLSGIFRVLEDMLGYTKEEWCKTYNMVSSNEYSDYCFTRVYEAILLEDNSTYYSNEDNAMKCIYDPNPESSKLH